MTVFRHVVLFRVHDEVDDSEVAEAIGRLRSLAGADGLRSFEVHHSLDTRKGRVIVENATFDDRQSFERFRLTENHAQVAGFLASMSDWWIGDYVAE